MVQAFGLSVVKQIVSKCLLFHALYLLFSLLSSSFSISFPDAFLLRSFPFLFYHSILLCFFLSFSLPLFTSHESSSLLCLHLFLFFLSFLSLLYYSNSFMSLCLSPLLVVPLTCRQTWLCLMYWQHSQNEELSARPRRTYNSLKCPCFFL